MRIAVLALALLAGCSDRTATATSNAANPGFAATAKPVPAATPVAMQDDPSGWAGRWIGVEGMTLDIAPAPAGRYRLAMQWDLDHKGVFTGEATSDPGVPSIVFEREGRTETLRHTDGDTTGLKYLAGKKDCLTVQPGEGYCRD